MATPRPPLDTLDKNSSPLHDVENDKQQLSEHGNSSNRKGCKLDGLTMYGLELHPENFPDGGWEANSVLIGSFFGLIADFGIPNSMGAIEAYILKNQLAHLKANTVLWIFSLYLGVMFLGGVLFGTLFDRYGARRLLISGTAIMFAGLIATAELTQLYQFILSFGVTTALGTSLAMTPLIGVLSHWFLKRRAMACSLATIGGLIGSSVFAVMLQDLYSRVGYKWAIRALAFICLFCMTVAIILVRDRKDVICTASNDLPRSGDDIEKSSISPALTSDFKGTASSTEFMTAESEPENDRTQSHSSRWDRFVCWLKRACGRLSPFKEVRFVALSIAVSLAELNFMTVLTFLTSFALAGKVDERKAYLLLTVINLCGIPSRIATGLLADQYGRFNMMLLTSIFSLIFVWGLLVPSNGRLLYLYVFAAFYGVLISAVMSLFAACLSQICSALEFGKHYGALYFCLAFLTVLGMFFSSMVANNGSAHDYKMWVVFEGCVSTASVVAWIWARWCNVKFRICKF